MSLISQIEPIELKEETVSQLNEQAKELQEAVLSSPKNEQLNSLDDFNKANSFEESEHKDTKQAVANDTTQISSNSHVSNTAIENPPETISSTETASVSIHKKNPFESVRANSDELSILISALEVQKNKTVTTTKVANTDIVDKLSKIVNGKNEESTVITNEQPLNTSSSFNDAFNNPLLDSNINLKLIDDIGSYLKLLRDRANQYLEEAGGSNTNVDGRLSIEGISEIVSDMTSSTKATQSSQSSEITSSVISKLPSFGANGEIIPASNTEALSVNSIKTPIEEVPFDVSDDSVLESKTAENNTVVSNTNINDPVKNNSQINDFEKIATEFISSNDGTNSKPSNQESEFTLEPMQSQLSGAENLRLAQEAALAQIQQNTQLDEKLKAESVYLNKNSVLEEDSKSSEQNTNTVLDEESVAFEDDNRVETILDSDTNISSPSSSSQNTAQNSIETNNKADVAVSSGNRITLKYQKGFFDKVIDPKSYPFNLDMKTVDEAYEYALSQNVRLNTPIRASHSTTNDFSQELSIALENALVGKYGNYKNEAENLGGEDLTFKDNNSFNSDINASTTENIDTNSQEIIDNDIQEDTQTTVQNQSNYVEETDDGDEDDTVEAQVVSGNDFNHVEQSSSENTSNLVDGNPKALRESTLKLLEEDLQFENKRLGRKLEAKDFYPKVAKTDPWFQTILKSGYNDGPVFSALCYSNRIINGDNKYDWTLEISKDFELLVNAPDFHHNLRTKFSIVMNHPIELKLVTVPGVPNNSPENLASYWYLKAIEDARTNIANNKNLALLLEHLGEDIRTMKLSLYTQLTLPNPNSK